MDIEKENQRIETMLNKAKKTLYKAPEGTIVFSKSNDCIQFYEKLDDGKRKYIPKNDIVRIRQLTGKMYAEKIISNLSIEKTRIEHFLKFYNTNKAVDIFNSIPIEARQLIHPYELSDDEYAEQWAKEAYETKGIGKDEQYFTTEQGEKVRSKSELTIANKLYIKGIKYRYEQPLYLRGFGTMHPDFTILNKHTRQEIILEHFGLMSNPEYVELFVKKINTYACNGIVMGHRLFCTFETKSQPFDTKQLDNILKELE